MNLRSFVVPAACGCALAAGLFAAPVEIRAEDGDAIEIGDIYVVGTRRPVRSTADTPAPIDLIGGEDFTDQGTTNLPNLMRTLVPSYNVSTQPISDEATFIRPANLRGLAPDHTLVFVNGKRRHRAAVITYLGNGVSESSQGPDISVIPGIALKRVEVLRDTASAQYGSDAIAGVVNFVLKDRPDGGMVETQWGRTYSGDGAAYRIATNVGIPVSESGFANLSAQWHEAEPTVRSVQRDDAARIIAAGNTGVRQPYAQIWGAPEVSGDYTVFLNSGIELGEQTEAYAFGNVAARETEGGFFFRHPNWRKGVFVNKERSYRLVGDLNPEDGNECPELPFERYEFRDFSNFSSDNPGCFIFNERFPSGFTPSFKGEVSDIAGTAGLRGAFESGLTYDMSYTHGQSSIDYSIRNTINPSLGPRTPIQFDLGSFTQTEQTVNIDLTYEIDVPSFDSPLHTAAGAEWRQEQFEISAGQQESWLPGPLASQGFGVAANGYPGFRPEQARTWKRSNIAGYVDLEADVLSDLTIATMGRVENFETFGGTTDFKLGALYQVTPDVGLRGSASTGFRAPTLGQENASKVTTEFGPDGLRQVATLSVNCPEARLKGAKPLQPEESVTYTVGVVAESGPLSVTADIYNIDVEGRLGVSANSTLTDAEKRRVGNDACFPAADVLEIRYLGNGFDTRTRGIDVVASVDIPAASSAFEGGETELVFVGNWMRTKVTDFDPAFLTDTQFADTGIRKRILQLEGALPKFRFNATLRHEQARWSGFARLNYFGPYTETHLNDTTLLVEAGSEVTLDAEVSYAPMKGMELSIGAENLLDNFPDENPHSGIVGAKYPESSPMGMAGGFYYARARYVF